MEVTRLRIRHLRKEYVCERVWVMGAGEPRHLHPEFNHPTGFTHYYTADNGKRCDGVWLLPGQEGNIWWLEWK